MDRRRPLGAPWGPLGRPICVAPIVRPVALAAIGLWQGWIAWRLGFELASMVAALGLALALAFALWLREPSRRPLVTTLLLVPFAIVLVASVLRINGAALELRSKVEEGVELATPVRLALGRAICQGRWPPVDHASLGLEGAGAYSGRYTRGVQGELLEAGAGRVTISYGRIAAPPSMPALEIVAGAELVLEGRCDRAERVRWEMAAGLVRDVASRIAPWRVCWLCR